VRKDPVPWWLAHPRASRSPKYRGCSDGEDVALPLDGRMRSGKKGGMVVERAFMRETSFTACLGALRVSWKRARRDDARPEGRCDSLGGNRKKTSRSCLPYQRLRGGGNEKGLLRLPRKRLLSSRKESAETSRLVNVKAQLSTRVSKIRLFDTGVGKKKKKAEVLVEERTRISPGKEKRSTKRYFVGGKTSEVTTVPVAQVAERETKKTTRKREIRRPAQRNLEGFGTQVRISKKGKNRRILRDASSAAQSTSAGDGPGNESG